MQSVRWYLRRLGSMSAAELLWRCRQRILDLTDRFMIPLRCRSGWPRHVLTGLEDRSLAPADRPAGAGQRPATSTSAVGAHLRSGNLRFTSAETRRWQPDLITRAERALAHHVDLFNLRDHCLGKTIEWNYEHRAGRRTPMSVAPAIDYRDYASTGDCKFVWEPNRHHHLVVLGRAYRITGDERYAAGVIEQLTDWASQCPYGYGMNWRSPLELGIRLINWAWAWELIGSSSLLTAERRAWLARLVYQHLFEITRRYSRFSSANNHLIGEAAGVFVATCFFPKIRRADCWRRQSRDILLREMLRQTYGDGGTREQATGYHLFTMQLFLVAGLAARHVGDDFPPPYWRRLEKMFEFVAGLSEGAGTLPMIGDCDDACVLDLGGRDQPIQALMSVGAILFRRSDFAALTDGFAEPAFWLLGSEGRERFEGLRSSGGPRMLGSRAFAESGYYLLQQGGADAPGPTSVLFDCGELGFLSTAAHGHADALSVVLRIGGIDVLVDPGTYDYFTHPEWREYFRSSRAHNTVVIDDVDQSQMLGPFLWGRRATCRLLRWEPKEGGGMVCAEHDGYARLPDPVIHRRTVTLQEAGTRLSVRDEIVAHGAHKVVAYWHLGEQCTVAPMDSNRFRAEFAGGSATIACDPGLSVTLLRGSENPILGWVSRGYHRKVPSTTLVAECMSNGDLSLTTEITITACTPP